MLTACGRPQGGGVRFMRTHVDKGRSKTWFFWCYKWMATKSQY